MSEESGRVLPGVSSTVASAGPRSSNAGLLLSLTEFRFIVLEINDPIVPGQPLSFTWSTTPFKLPFDLGQVTASLYLLDAAGKRPFPQAPLMTMNVKGSDITAGGYTSPILILGPIGSNDPQASSLYKVGGDQGLELELVGDGKDAGPFLSWVSSLNVIREGNTLAWGWTDPPFVIPTAAQTLPTKHVAWKDRYFLAGTLLNQSPNSAKDCSLTLIEVDTEGNDRTYGPDNQPPRLQKSGGQVVVPWGGVDGFVQDWSWFVSFVNNINGPLNKGFQYSVNADIVDEYGNTYPTRELLNDAWVAVTVSDQKKNAAKAGEAAFGAFVGCSAAALAFVWLPPVSAGFAVGAAAAAAVAGGCSKIAGDPPEANSRYATAVEVRVPELGDVLQRCEPLSVTSTVLNAALRLVTDVDALSEVEGRMLGARQAKDNSSLELQRASYQGLLRDIAVQSERLTHYAPLLARELDASVILAHSNVRDGGRNENITVPPRVEELLRHGKLGGDAAPVLAQMVNGATLPPPTATSISDALMAMAGLLSLLAHAADNNGRKVLHRFRDECG